MTTEPRRGRWKRLDWAACRALRNLPHRPETDALLERSSRLAEHGTVWLAAAAAGFVVDRARRSSWIRAAIAVAATEAAGQRIKRLTRRPRPYLPGLRPLAATPALYSFPSAHTATACAAASSFPRGRRLVVVAAAVTALSRPYAGVHYPSDVVAGAALGFAVARTLTRPGRG
jgi:undecaprenyl-diphosphatase